MNDDTPAEVLWNEGYKAAWRRTLTAALSALSVDDPDEAASLAWIVERGEVIACLRVVCKEFGDNDWPDDLHITDIIEKHLAPYIEQS